MSGATPGPGLTDATMSTPNPSLKTELAEYNRRLDRCLRTRYQMTLRTYRLIKATTQLLGVAAGILAMTQGADPMYAFALIAGIIGGPELFEMALESQPTTSESDDEN